MGSVAGSLNSSGVVTATPLYSPYGNVRYSNGALPTSYGYHPPAQRCHRLSRR